jgi:hypothetical protein
MSLNHFKSYNQSSDRKEIKTAYLIHKDTLVAYDHKKIIELL